MKPDFRSFTVRLVICAAFLFAIGYGGAQLVPQRALPTPTSTPTATNLSNVPAEASEQGTVSRVVDGDTVKVVLSGEEKTVRLIGINTPETVDPQKPVECYGKEASDYAKTLLTGQTVAMSSDASQQDMDRYGRLLRYLYLPSGLFVNEKLVREGYAVEYTYDRPYVFQAEFRQAEQEAKQAGLGLWTACPQTPNPNP